MPTLLIAKPDGALVRQHLLEPRSTVVVGRGEDCDLVVRSERISRHHALVFEHRGRWFAVDLDSTAGLALDDRPVEVHEFTPDRLWVRMGPLVVWLEDWVPEARTEAMPRPIVPDGVGAGMPIPGRDPEGIPFLRPARDPRPLFIHFRDPGSGDRRLYDFSNADRVTFGRDGGCDLVVDTAETLDLHGLLYREGPLWKLLDLQPIDRDREPNRRRRIRMLDGMPVRIGRLQGTVLVPEPVIRDGEVNLSIGLQLEDDHESSDREDGAGKDRISPAEPPNGEKP